MAASLIVALHERRSAAASAKDERIKGVYPWGNQWPPPNDAKANQFGLYDMGGNVFQMCQDELYSGEYVLRGGSWEDGGTRPEALLSSHRGMTPPDDRQNVVGFRCVLVDESYR
jgi:formylglycine-generating enzyme required for sulfatase activity